MVPVKRQDGLASREGRVQGQPGVPMSQNPHEWRARKMKEQHRATCVPCILTVNPIFDIIFILKDHQTIL